MDLPVDDTSLYTYRPLASTNHIRLLKVYSTLCWAAPRRPEADLRRNHNSTAAQTERIEAQLVEKDISKTEGDYEALSYAWGEPLFSERLYIDR